MAVSSTDHSGSRALAHSQPTKGHIVEVLQLWAGATFKATNTYFVAARACQSVSTTREGSCPLLETWRNWVMFAYFLRGCCLLVSHLLWSQTQQSVRETGSLCDQAASIGSVFSGAMRLTLSCLVPVLHLWRVRRTGTTYHLQGITLLPRGRVRGSTLPCVFCMYVFTYDIPKTQTL